MAERPVKAAYWLAAENNKFPAAKINVSPFTHLLCGFATLNPRTKEVVFPSPEAPFTTFTETVRQKSNNRVKTILSIGGKKSQLEAFATMASEVADRKKFIDSSIALARRHRFDGLDLSWIYPRNESEMEDLGALLVEWRAARDKEARLNQQQQPLLLTAAVYFSPNLGTLTYPINEVKSNLDWVNVMAYDFTDPVRSKEVTAAPAALSEAKRGVDDWLASAKEVVLGLPFCGYAWKLADPNETAIGAAAQGPYKGPDGFKPYGEIKKLLDDGVNQVYDPMLVTDYCCQGTMWVGYDGPDSIKAKLSYAKNEKALLGYFAWTVGWDDENSQLAETASTAWP